VKSAVKFINKFETTAGDIAISNGYDFVVCGHIHHPEIKILENEKGKVIYLNSGDWVENLTALEYDKGAWRIYSYKEDKVAQSIKLRKRITEDTDEIFRDLVNQFLTVRK
jgi:UDP-2,3-diacylglucosamine pyrophosphatase LpxH